MNKTEGTKVPEQSLSDVETMNGSNSMLKGKCSGSTNWQLCIEKDC